ncbi:MAG: hypothetical protein M1834_009079 [Cirrosporium novae-zelandiae]|nr:MAG: hypothetical protein M1834_009079 [Cirrosporium novae-zelandiae]
MAPSPAAGKGVGTVPKTPTKPGKNPASSSTSKLGKAAGTPGGPVKLTKQSPQSTLKGAASKAKGAAPTSDISSPKLPPRPKEVEKAVEPVKETVPETPEVEDVPEEAEGKISMKDNDLTEEVEETPGKVSQAGNETETGEQSSVGELEEAAPEPVGEEEETVTGGPVGEATGAVHEDTEESAGEDVVGGVEEEADDAVGGAKETIQGEEEEELEEPEEEPAEEAEEEQEPAPEEAQELEEAPEPEEALAPKEDLEPEEAPVPKKVTSQAGSRGVSSVRSKAGSLASGAKSLAGKAGGIGGIAKESSQKLVNGDAKGAAEGTVDGAQDTATGAVEDAQETADGVAGEVSDAVEDLYVDPTEYVSHLKGLEIGESGEVIGLDGEPLGRLEEGDAEYLVGQTIGDNGEILDEDGDLIGRVAVLPEAAQRLAEQAQKEAQEAAREAEEAAGEAQDELPAGVPSLPDVGVLEGLEVGEGGEILNKEGQPLGKLVEGEPEDLVGHTLNEKGEIIDEDGDVIGRAEVVHGEAADKLKETQETAEGVVEGVPEAAERAVEGAPETLDGAAEGVAETAEGAADEAQEAVPKLEPTFSILEGKKINKKGKILDDEGEVLAQLTEDSDLKACVGRIPNEQGLILDNDGDIIGRIEIVSGEAADEAMKNLYPEGLPTEEVTEIPEVPEVPEAEVPELPNIEELADQLDLSILDGLKVNKKGQVLNEEGEPIAKISEGEVADLAGKKINSKGEVLDKDGNVIGKVELLPDFVKDLAEEQGVEIQKPELPDFSILDGYRVNKKGEVINEDGDVIAKLSDGKLSDVAGKKLNEKGEILDKDGNVIGKVELTPEVAEELVPEVEKPDLELSDLSVLDGLKINKKGEVVNEDGDPIARLAEGELSELIGKKLNEKGQVVDAEGNVIGRVELIPEIAEEIAEQVQEGPDLSFLDGLKVNKKGEVLNEDGEPIARLTEGDIAVIAGMKLNENGEVLDAEGNVIGKVTPIDQIVDEGPQLPPLSVLNGLRCNKQGKIVDPDGNPVGELIEGDPKRIARLRAVCDEEGRFWDSRGNIIGRAQTIFVEQPEEEPPFAGLEGLIVVKDGWVEDENNNIVGQLVEGDPKKLVGRAVDEDGDVIDKRGNVVGHAERYEPPEEPEPEKPDLSVLNGLILNKQGNVIGPSGIPIARLVEGNVKELAGRPVDGEGQIWDSAGKVVGRCELIPPEEREDKPEGPFAGLEGVHVVKGGMVEDEEGNTVGIVVEGDPKKLVGRMVDEDGDIVDKYGNVKGHADPYEEPEEEPEDLSILDGKMVNKAGNIVDATGTVFGNVVEGDVKSLVGKKVDGKGQIWSDNGKVVGRAALIPGGVDYKREGPFSGFDGLHIGKDGVVQDPSGQIVGRLIEGDPKQLLGRSVDEEGDVVDKNGNPIGHCERWEPEEKERHISPMSGHKVNKEGEIRDDNGDLIGRVTAGNVAALVGKTVDDNGYVVDNDGNKIGECTLIENIPEDEELPQMTEEELAALKQKEEDAELAGKMCRILEDTLEKIQPVLKMILEHIEKADRTPKDELDEEELVQNVRPLIEEGSRILQECNGSLRGLDPDGHIAANAKARAGTKEATPEEHRLAELLKELTQNVVTTIDKARRRINDMPHAKKKLNPLWALLTEPLFQIIAAVGLLLAGVLGLVGRLLNGLGLGGLVNGLLGGLGINKLLGGLGLGSITEALGLTSKKKER